MPTLGQLILLFTAAALFALALFLSVVRLRVDRSIFRVAGKSCLYWGVATSVAVLMWHGAVTGRWVPAGDNFGALIWLAVLIALFTAYVQGTRPLAALDWFLLPVVIGLLACAAVLGRTEYQSYYVGRSWRYVHYATSFGGAAAFAVAAAGGAMYVVASGRLRRKRPAGKYLGSLERLERLNLTAVTLGFALLTVGIVTGAVEMIRSQKPTSPWKVVLAGCVWVVYATVLHAPINPVFRGRRAAALSVLGFFLMIGVLVAVQFGGTGR